MKPLRRLREYLERRAQFKRDRALLATMSPSEKLAERNRRRTEWMRWQAGARDGDEGES